MSDFEQWALNNGYCHRDLVKNANGDYCTPMALHGFKAFNGAIASMQEEAEKQEPTVLVEHVSERYAFCMVAKGKALQAGQMLYANLPSAASKIAEQDARIKELEQQLAKLEVNHSLLRKHVRMAIDIKSMSDECYDFLTAAIRQIGGAE